MLQRKDLATLAKLAALPQAWKAYADAILQGATYARAYKAAFPNCADGTARTQGPLLIRKPAVQLYLEQVGAARREFDEAASGGDIMRAAAIVVREVGRDVLHGDRSPQMLRAFGDLVAKCGGATSPQDSEQGKTALDALRALRED